MGHEALVNGLLLLRIRLGPQDVAALTDSLQSYSHFLQQAHEEGSGKNDSSCRGHPITVVMQACSECYPTTNPRMAMATFTGPGHQTLR
jgi:hypothetical protein